METLKCTLYYFLGLSIEKLMLKMIFLTLFCIFATVTSEIHDLHYIYTALSKPISQPGVYQFTPMEILDNRPIDFHNSEDKVKKLLQKWMEEQNEEDYLEKDTESRKSKEQWFDVSVKILMERMHQNKSDPDVHILQWMHGCQAEKTPDGKLKFHNGFNRYGYDGEDFLSFDSKNMVWVAHANAAESTKKKWDNMPILSHYTKGYLETECVQWLEKFLKYQELEIQTLSPPEVHLFSKKSTSPDYRTLVCLATGFYPKNVTVDILKDGVLLAESDGVASSGVRPNGERKETYQLRKWLEIEASDTSKYSCRIHHQTLPSPIEESRAPPEVHLFSKNSTSPDYRTLVCLATGFYPKDVTVDILKDGAPLAESDGVASSGVRPNGERKETYQLRKWLEIEASDTAKYSCRIHNRTLPSPIKESREIHDLRYIYTALSKPISQPGIYQFTAMGIMNDRPIDIYNSEDKVKKPLQKWMEEHNEKDYWEKGTQSRRSKEQWFDVNIKILMERMHQNQSDPDVHILQWMHGCQVEKTTDGRLKFYKGFDQYGYDGNDFLAFDSKNMAWVAPVPAAESTKKKWDNVPILSQYTKGYLETDCVHWLEKFLKFQDEEIQSFSPPKVHVFSKKSTSPDYRTLVCLATGFYPKQVSVNILKDGVPLAESDGVASSGVRPNGDHKETYQLRKWLEIKASDTSKYSCRTHHRALPSPIEEFWDGKCCNCDGDNTGAIGGAIVGVVLLIVLVAVLVYFLRKKMIEKKKAAQAHVNRLNQPLCPLVVNGNGLACESTILSPGGKPETGSKGSLDSGKGSTDSDEPKEVTKPLVANEEGKQQPQLEAVEVV